MEEKRIRTALLSAYHKNDQLLDLARTLNQLDIQLYASGGTAAFLRQRGLTVTPLETLTDFNQMLGGRVKTLHPRVFGGILARPDEDLADIEHFQLPLFDMVVVDLYPFPGGRANVSETEAIELIDIGGVALIRAAAKNFHHVLVVPHRQYWPEVIEQLIREQGAVSLAYRRQMAARAFRWTAYYDTAIAGYLHPEMDEQAPFVVGARQVRRLRYGENPHQRGWLTFTNDLPIEQLSGKELSFNNLLDVRAALALIRDLPEKITAAVLKHTIPCGVAVAETPGQALERAWASDPESAFGGIIILNEEVDDEVAAFLDKRFYEVLIAPGYTASALAQLRRRKQRILLQYQFSGGEDRQVFSALGGFLVQDEDRLLLQGEIQWIPEAPPAPVQQEALFAWRVAKHLKSNAVAITRNRQLIGFGVGQPSRVRAVEHAIAHMQRFGFSPEGAVLASEAFFPFPDSVEKAAEAGIRVVLQPGGSRNDAQVIQRAEELGLTMGLTGTRHFRHL